MDEILNQYKAFGAVNDLIWGTGKIKNNNNNVVSNNNNVVSNLHVSQMQLTIVFLLPVFGKHQTYTPLKNCIALFSYR